MIFRRLVDKATVARMEALIKDGMQASFDAAAKGWTVESQSHTVTYHHETDELEFTFVATPPEKTNGCNRDAGLAEPRETDAGAG